MSAAHLRLAFRRVKRLRAALDDVTHAVEFRRRAPQPERMQRLEFAGFGLRVERLGHDGERATDAGESAVLRATAEFDGAVARAGNFVNRMRQRRVGDVRLVSRVEQNDGLVFERVFHPRLKLRPVRRRAGRIVRRAKINHVHVPLRRFGNETVAGFARQINQLGISARLVGLAGVAGHHVRVHINRINRVADGDFVFVRRGCRGCCRCRISCRR